MDSFDVVRDEFNARKIGALGAIQRLVNSGWLREDAEDAIFELQYDLDHSVSNGDRADG
jgi:hypothetical protein